MITVVQTFETPNGKEIHIKRNAIGKLYIEFATGGEKPREFDGFFTKERYAVEVINRYLHRKQEAADKKTAKETKKEK